MHKFETPYQTYDTAHASLVKNVLRQNVNNFLHRIVEPHIPSTSVRPILTLSVYPTTLHF